MRQCPKPPLQSGVEQLPDGGWGGGGEGGRGAVPDPPGFPWAGRRRSGGGSGTAPRRPSPLPVKTQDDRDPVAI